MCEICRSGSFTSSEWIDDAVASACAWPIGETRPACLQPAAVDVRQRSVIEHRCGPCMSVIGPVSGPSGVFGGVGVVRNEPVPINSQETCGRCGRRAQFAWRLNVRMPVCRAHALLNDWLPAPQPVAAV
jgi:hypothetical protein